MERGKIKKMMKKFGYKYGEDFTFVLESCVFNKNVKKEHIKKILNFQNKGESENGMS